MIEFSNQPVIAANLAWRAAAGRVLSSDRAEQLTPGHVSGRCACPRIVEYIDAEILRLQTGTILIDGSYAVTEARQRSLKGRRSCEGTGNEPRGTGEDIEAGYFRGSDACVVVAASVRRRCLES
jgi:hypothetical protein